MQHHPNIALSFEPRVHLLVPEKEIIGVLEFLGLQMIAGRVDIGLFDQFTNTLISICPGDFRLELVEAKRKLKAILAQCGAQEVAGG